jgi:hypothetical protein
LPGWRRERKRRGWIGIGNQERRSQRWEKEKKAPDKDRGGTEREEGGMDFSKDLYVKSENCRDLFVK